MRIQDPSLTIPFGWQLAMPDEHLRAGTYWALRDAVWRYQDAHFQERWNDATLQDCLCKSLPVASTNCDEGETPHYADLDALPAFRMKEEQTWGPILWDLLHRKKVSTVEHPGMWLREFHRRVPCTVCSAHFQQVMNDLPPDFTSDDAFFVRGVEWHNAVNKSLGKREWTVNEARAFYQLQDQESQPAAEPPADPQAAQDAP